MRAAASSALHRWVPHPVLSILIAMAWLMLQQSLALPQWIAAGAIGLVVPRLLRRFLRPTRRRLTLRGAWRAAWVTAQLIVIVLWDIVASNVEVARMIVWPRAQTLPAWVPVPLDVEEPLAITLLAMIITTTPGTLSCVVDDERREILVHALHCDDPKALAAQIKRRYESRLKEILE